MQNSHLKALQNKHSKLERDIQSELCHPARNDLLIEKLKKEKLRIKEWIARTQGPPAPVVQPEAKKPEPIKPEEIKFVKAPPLAKPKAAKAKPAKAKRVLAKPERAKSVKTGART